ncbi:MAG: hypothetical protein ACI8VE_002899 [Natrialbaceae archaeon]|jgi:hypothetical protein
MGKKLSIFNLAIGAFLSGYAGWYVLRGPFLNQEFPSRWFLLGALGMFLVGVVAMSWGAKGYLYGRESDRVQPPDSHV